MARRNVSLSHGAGENLDRFIEHLHGQTGMSVSGARAIERVLESIDRALTLSRQGRLGSIRAIHQALGLPPVNLPSSPEEA